MYFIIYIHILIGFDAIDNAKIKNNFEEQPVGKKMAPFNPSSINQMLKKKKNENNNSYSNSHKILFLI